jgi:hypothetical protein
MDGELGALADALRTGMLREAVASCS